MIIVSSCGCLHPIHWSQVLSREWRCNEGSADRRCSKYIWVINNFIANKGVAYIRCLAVCAMPYICIFLWMYHTIISLYGQLFLSNHDQLCGTILLSSYQRSLSLKYFIILTRCICRCDFTFQLSADWYDTNYGFCVSNIWMMIWSIRQWYVFNCGVNMFTNI